MTQLAFVFPGQGSQQLGMLADVAESISSDSSYLWRSL
jgi:malonyl CoA-acyl carrier protein transacylase